ncbi:MAG: helicase-related protein [Desulfitobacteriaceae bacterium]|nr:helicase-related protein [Desulfitobacteriaceae bacterium]
MHFFLTYVEEIGFRFSPFPEMDKHFFKKDTEFLNIGLPLAFLETIVPKTMSKHNIKEKLNKKFKFQGNSSGLRGCEWQKAGNMTGSVDFEGGDKTGDFDLYIRGHQITENELERLAVQIKADPEAIKRLVHMRVLMGWGEWIPAVRLEGKRWRCQRCGETELEEWPGVWGMMETCRSCSSLGASSSQQVSYRDKRGLGKETEPVCFDLQPSLTLAQKRASSQVLEFVRHSQLNEALLWAACGAGKTEVCFTSAAWALKEGKSVLFAAPRQDVIHDVAPRLQRNFPGLQFQVLSGRNPVKYQKGTLVLATTHQILRFYQAFDLVFLDEMDAFPYKGSRILQWGLKQALSAGGKILYLTATPSEAVLRRNNEEGKNLIRLPARYHRYPLPVPEWLKFRFLPEKPKLTENLIVWLQNMVSQGVTIIFVPKISWVLPLVNYLRIKYPGWRIEGSYSSDPARKQKIEGLVKGNYCLFICTSILERGVTIPNAQVIVLAADHPVFDERALVQMAGRAGRTKEHPVGMVLFVSGRKIPAVFKAINWIKEQNSFADNLGLID